MNVNDVVYVKLTKTVLEIYEQHIKEIQKLVTFISVIDSFMRGKIKDGVLVMQLWEIMQIFGAYFIVGSEPPFMEIDILHARNISS